MSGLFAPPPLPTESGAVPSGPSAPHPFTIGAHESVNPIPKLLLSFPVPRMISQMHLETAWAREDDTCAGGIDSAAAPPSQQGWCSDDIDSAVRGIQQSAQQLLLSGSCSLFFQEQYHHEVAATACAGAEAGARISTACAARHVSAAAAPGIKGLLSSASPGAIVLDAAQLAKRHSDAPRASTASVSHGDASARHHVPLTRVPKAELWSRNDEGPSIGVRTRRSSDVGGAWAGTSSDSLDTGGGGSRTGEAAGAAGAAVRRGSATAGAHGTATASHNVYEPRTRAAVLPAGGAEQASPASFADWLQARSGRSSCTAADTASLLQVASSLPLQTRPFDSVPSSQLASFLLGLADEAKAAVAEEADAAQWNARALLCCRCLAHPHFPADAVPDTVVGTLVDLFARLVRDTTACLHEEQQGAAALAAADAAGGSSDDRRPTEKPRLAPAAGRRVTAAASTIAAAPSPSSTLSSVLERLRSFLGAFAAIACSPTLRLLSDTDVYRLEELCHQCLFRVTRGCSKELHGLYCSYVMDLAVHTYRCLWNRLGVQRHAAVEAFFHQLPVSELLTQRVYQTHAGGCTVLPLTVALLAAAQSTLVLPDASGSTTTAEALQQQCAAWTHCLLHTFLLGSRGERDRTEEGLAWSAVTRLAEDLVDLLGVPEWPGADLLLRSLVMGFAQLTLSSESAASAEAEALRPLAIDVLGGVAARLLDAQRFPVSAAILAEMERLGDSASASSSAARVALQHVLGNFPLLCPEDQQAWERLCSSGGSDDRVAADSGGERERYLSDLIASVYMAESQLIADPSTAADYAAVWFHVRAAQVLSWACLSDTGEAAWLPAHSVDALLRWRRPTGLGGGSSGERAINWSEVCTWTRCVSTQSSKSMLSLRMRHTVVSMLLSVFHVKDAQGNPVAVSDAVHKKALAQLARLTALHPGLQRYLWPIARQCVRDESARVRESIVPLLLTLLSDAAQPDGDGDAASSAPTSAAVQEGIAAEVIGSLLHLLHDRSVAVVTRALATVDAFLTDGAYAYLFASPQGASLMSFIQQRLLPFAGPAAEPKHRQEVVRHFVHRWVVTLADADGSFTGAHAQLAKELLALTVMGAPEFPYDVTAEHPLVHVLQGMHAQVAAHDTAREAPARTGGAAAPPRKRQRGYHVDATQLLHVMRCAAQSLWMRFQCFHSGEDAVACLASLRVLALSRSEWVMPLAEVLVQSLAYPPPSTSPLANSADALGGALLQLCQTMHGILQAPKLPLISLDYLARCLTTLLSKYVGPFQQRVIVASCGALCGLITCGAKHRLSAQVNVPYLQLCYSLMNTYYCRVRALLPTLATQPHSIAYTQRFLFLLSEFLRMYPGWRQQPPHPALLDDAPSAAGGGKSVLAAGLGIAANTYQLIEDVVQNCGDSAARERVAVIALRVVASLCMLDPTTYFYRAEAQIRAALTSADHNLQLQGLTLLSDFLKEEDERVDSASRHATRLDTTALILGTAPRSRSRSSDSDSDGDEQRCSGAVQRRGGASAASAAPRRGSGMKRGRRQEKSDREGEGTKRIHAGRAAAAAAPMAVEDFNSGMSTWVFQQFHDLISPLACGSPHVPIRTLCLRLFQQAAHGGLLPPDKYVRVLIALSADVHAPLRQQATACLATHCDRHEEVVAAAAGRGVVLAFDLHHACGANLLRSATVAEPPVVDGVGRATRATTAAQSVHGALYSMLHRRARETMVTTLVRYFYQDGKVTHWHCEHTVEVPAATTTLAADPSASKAAPESGRLLAAMHPVLFLSHLTLVLFALPFQSEGEVVHVLQQSRAALDLHGQAAVDWLQASEDSSGDGAELMRWKAVGALLLCYLRRALLTEYRLSAGRVQRYQGRVRGGAGGGSSLYSAPLRRRSAEESTGVAQLQRRVEELVQRLAPLIVAPLTADSGARCATALQGVATELAAALLEETAEADGGTANARAAKAGGGARGTKTSTVSAKRPEGQKRKRRRDVSSSDTDRSSSSSEGDSDTESTASMTSSLTSDASTTSSTPSS